MLTCRLVCVWHDMNLSTVYLHATQDFIGVKICCTKKANEYIDF